MFCTVSRGVTVSMHEPPALPCLESQALRYRMRRAPAPLSVTRLPPSSTTWLTVLRTFAVAVIVIVTGSGPQSKVMMPPAATALTTAAEVQLAGVPFPTVRVGLLVSTARAADGTDACPLG